MCAARRCDFPVPDPMQSSRWISCQAEATNTIAGPNGESVGLCSAHWEQFEQACIFLFSFETSPTELSFPVSGGRVFVEPKKTGIVH